jgi:hypothetical protein
MKQSAFIEHAKEMLESDSRLGALFLGGSFGRGSADDYSDLDFVGVAATADHIEMATAWRETVASFAPVVYWSQRSGGGLLLNAVTEEWLRIDLWLVDTSFFLENLLSPAPHYAQSTVKMLVDRHDIASKLPASLLATSPNPDTVNYLIGEFIRVLGLIAVGMGRGEDVLGVTGAGLLRDLLTRLMVEETQSPERGGMLHLSRTVTPEQMAVLRALPYPGPHREEILAAHWATAAAFFPRARALADDAGITWPTAFEAATRRHLQRAFGADFLAW